MIAFLLVEQSLLTQPLLYLSAYFERRRSDYYDRLQAVRERGELEEWLGFFLTGVAEESADAVTRAERLVDLREEYRQRLVGDRSRAAEVVDLVFQNPVLTTTRIANALETSLQSALNRVRRLEADGIVREVRGIPGDRSAGCATRCSTCSSRTWLTSSRRPPDAAASGHQGGGRTERAVGAAVAVGGGGGRRAAAAGR